MMPGSESGALQEGIIDQNTESENGNGFAADT